MPEKFHQRFKINVGLEEAQRRFVNRAHNLVWEAYLYEIPNFVRKDAELHIITALGDRYDPHRSFSKQIGNDYFRNLHALEAFHQGLQLSL